MNIIILVLTAISLLIVTPNKGRSESIYDRGLDKLIDLAAPESNENQRQMEKNAMKFTLETNDDRARDELSNIHNAIGREHGAGSDVFMETPYVYHSVEPNPSRSIYVIYHYPEPGENYIGYIELIEDGYYSTGKTIETVYRVNGKDPGTYKKIIVSSTFYFSHVNGSEKLPIESFVAFYNTEHPVIFSSNGKFEKVDWHPFSASGSDGFYIAPDRIEQFSSHELKNLDFSGKFDWEKVNKRLEPLLRYEKLWLIVKGASNFEKFTKHVAAINVDNYVD